MFCNVFVKGSKAFMTGGGLHMFYFSAVVYRSVFLIGLGENTNCD